MKLKSSPVNQAARAGKKTTRASRAARIWPYLRQPDWRFKEKDLVKFVIKVW